LTARNGGYHAQRRSLTFPDKKGNASQRIALFNYQFIGGYLWLLTASVALLRGGDSAAVLSPLSGIALLPGLLRILLLLMLRVLAAVLTALLTTAWIVFMGTLSGLRALLIGHLKPPGIFIPSSYVRFALPN
jgi:hypothetical protein